MRLPAGRIMVAGVVAASALVLVGGGGPAASEPQVPVTQAIAVTPAMASTQTAREALLGTWVGSYTGYHDGAWESGEQKFVFTTMRGVHVKGTWQYRSQGQGQKWTAPAPVQLVVVPEADGEAGHWSVTGADENGIYIGHLSADGPSLQLSYQGSVNDLVTYDFNVTRR
jgi:hypothetical protein